MRAPFSGYRLRLIAGAILSLAGFAALPGMPAGANGLVPPLSLRDCFGEDTITSPQVSPDGTRLAFITPVNGHLSLAMYDIGTAKVHIVIRGQSDIRSFFWKDDERLVYRDRGVGDFGNVLIEADLQHRSIKPLAGYGMSVSSDAVFDTLPADPRHILITENNRIGEMDLDSGEFRYTEPLVPFHAFGGYVADRTGELRLRCRWAKGVMELQAGRGANGSFVPIRQWPMSDVLAVNFIGFAADPNSAYVITTEDGDLGVLHALDVRTGALGPALATGRSAELVGGIYSRDGSRLLGLRAADRLGEDQLWLDQTMRVIQGSINAALPGRRNLICSISTDGRMFVISSQVPGAPAVYFVLLLARGELRRLGASHPGIDQTRLGRTLAMDIKARDGFVIHTYLTLPPGWSLGEAPLPLIVVPQKQVFGARWTTGYNAWAQYLATHGYATLWVDYRGAWGYGRRYESAGFHEMTGKIPEDVEDATQWAIQAGYAAAGRIGLYGEDFGGTLALMAATDMPALYRCAAEAYGATDLTAFRNMRWEYDYRTRQKLETLYGFDADLLARRSPERALGRLQAEILDVYATYYSDFVYFGLTGRKHEPSQALTPLEVDLARLKKPFTHFRPQPLGADGWLHTEDWWVNYFGQISAFFDRELKEGKRS